MNAILSPGIRLMKHLGVQQKILLMGVLAVLAIVVTVWQLNARIAADLSFSEQETHASRLANPARRAMQAIQAHRGTAQAVIAGATNMNGRLAELQTAADKAFADAEPLMDDEGMRLGVNTFWEEARAEWGRAKAVATSADPVESFRLHTSAIDSLLRYITEVGERTNALLDPEVESFYLMQLFVIDAPAIAESFGQARARASAMAARKTANEAQRIELVVLRREGMARLGAAELAGAKVVAANPALKDEIGARLATMVSAAKTFSAQVDALLASPERSGLQPAQVFDTGSTVVDGAYAVYDAASQHFDTALVARIERVSGERWRSFGVIALCLAVLGYLFLAFRQTMYQALGGIEAGLRRVAQGEFTEAVKADSQDEFGSIGRTLNGVREQLKHRIEKDAVVARENLRVRSALDKATTNVMLADADGNIVYCNESVVRMLKGNEATLRRALPQLNVDKLIGENFDKFHKNPAHQRNLLGKLTTTYVSQIEVAGLHFKLTANPVFDAQGGRVGSVVEWLDRTNEVRAEEELAGVLEAAVGGRFDQRLTTDGKDGFFRQVAENINQLLVMVESGLNDVGRVLKSVARGDLTESISTDYAGTFGQIKDDMNATVERLRDVVGQIKEATEAVNVAAKEIAAGNSNLSARTEEQASSLEETASSMEELNATVRQNAESAGRAQTLAASSNEVARKGGEMVGRVVDTMSAIQESSKKIADIIGVIDSIAFQTNILALNAAVEAARAGEQGRGFAVVATEVRSLAQRSAQAAKEIKTLIDTSVGKVDDGAKLVREAGGTMQEVVTSFQGVTEIVNDISSASREQASGIEQVAAAVSQMDEMTQQNAALVEQAAAAAESMEEQARRLAEAVAMFRLKAGGARPVDAASSKAVKPVRKARAEKPQAPVKREVAVASAAAIESDEWEEF